jgi:hypothetical protein
MSPSPAAAAGEYEPTRPPETHTGRASCPRLGETHDGGCKRLSDLRRSHGEDMRPKTAAGSAARLLGQKGRRPGDSHTAASRICREASEGREILQPSGRISRTVIIRPEARSQLPFRRGSKAMKPSRSPAWSRGRGGKHAHFELQSLLMAFVIRNRNLDVNFATGLPAWHAPDEHGGACRQERPRRYEMSRLRSGSIHVAPHRSNGNVLVNNFTWNLRVRPQSASRYHWRRLLHFSRTSRTATRCRFRAHGVAQTSA